MRKVLILLVFALLPLSMMHAQEVEPTYPTLTALEEEPIPPRDRLELAERLLGVTENEIEAPPAAPPDRQAGDQDEFRVTNSDGGYTRTITATLEVVGDHIYLWVENGAQLSTDDLQALADFFDSEVYEPVRDLWGSEALPGIDGDLRVHGLFAYEMGSTTAAYVSSDDSYPDEAVEGSNEREMFYFNLDALGTSFDVIQTGVIVAHEFQHMIRQNLQSNEETWMNEGLSTFTEFYLTGTPDFFSYDFMYAPDTQLNHWNEDSGLRGANYGGAQLFLIYFYDRYGIEGLRQLSADSAPRGLQSVDNVLQALDQPDADTFFADWVVANRVIGSEWEWGYQSMDGFGFTALDEAVYSRYPVTVSDEVSQYATHYYSLPVMQGVKAMEIALEIPQSVQLIDSDRAGTMAYSNRGDMTNTRLTRAFDLTGVSSATLDYQVLYHLEDEWDYGYVMVSADDGATWDILSTPATTDANPYGTAYGSGYTGISGGGNDPAWIAESLSLDSYAGENILVRFEMITDDAINQPGIAVDDMRIDAINYAEDFEGAADGWTFDGWILSDNALPQSAWVQMIETVDGVVQVTRWLAEGTNTVWEFSPHPDAESLVLAVSALAPVTTEAMPYQLRIDTK